MRSAGMALLAPSVLSSGHGALRAGLTADLGLGTLLLLLGLKSMASAISIGSGFRGGLFFASLLMGALLGKAFAAVMLLISPLPMFPEVDLCACGHERTGGCHRRWPADDVLPGAGEHGQPAADCRRARRCRWFRR